MVRTAWAQMQKFVEGFCARFLLFMIGLREYREGLSIRKAAMIVKRRDLLKFGLLVLLYGSFAGPARAAASTDEKIALIAALGDLLAKSAEALSKFGDSIAHLTALGVQGYDAAAARKARSNLIDLRIQLEQLMVVNGSLIGTMDGYVELVSQTPRPSVENAARHWLGVVFKVQIVMAHIDALLKQVSELRNDFVLEDAYRGIQQALRGRINILDQLNALPAPLSHEELEALTKAGKEYRLLRDTTAKTSEQLADYVKSLR
ncbi:hypothetical protein ABIC03_003456 [Bradyrhizobium sp. RT6a]